MSEKNKNAAFLIIGNEILSGRTKDANLNFLALNLNSMGIDLLEVRVVADIEEEIILATNQLRKKFDYLFTSGGIGPTHDDITSESISKAFNLKYEKHKEAEEILLNFYGPEGVNKARLKMAFLPQGATLLKNSISSAPGFKVENVFVMAGIPAIFQTMVEAAKIHLKTGKVEISKEIKVSLTESLIAESFTKLQKKYPQVLMGSYPFKGGTALVFRSVNSEILEKSITEMIAILEKIKPNWAVEN